MKCTKKTVLLLLVMVSAVAVFAQDAGGQKGRFFTGGNFGLSLGRYTVINVSPQIGYRFSRLVEAGLGFNLQYASKREDSVGTPYSKTSQGIAGLNVFGRFYPVQSLFVQLQPELNYTFGRIKFYRPEQTFKLDAELVPCLFVGGGYSTPVGRGNFVTTVLYDVIQRPNSPYGNRPFVNFGYNFSL